MCLLPQVRKVFSHYFFKYFVYPFSVSFLLLKPCNTNVGTLDIFPDAKLKNSFKNIFFVFAAYFPDYSSISVSFNLQFIPSSVFLISVVAFFSSDWFFLTFPKSL